MESIYSVGILLGQNLMYNILGKTFWLTISGTNCIYSGPYKHGLYILTNRLVLTDFYSVRNPHSRNADRCNSQTNSVCSCVRSPCVFCPKSPIYRISVASGKLGTWGLSVQKHCREASDGLITSAYIYNTTWPKLSENTTLCDCVTVDLRLLNFRPIYL